MNMHRRFTGTAVALLLLLSIAASTAEIPPEESEQGLDEIRPLAEIAEVDEKEGMSLEEMTDAVTELAMSEYLDSATGFSMQYPSVFLFDEEQDGNSAATADGRATLVIDNMANETGFDEEALRTAINLEIQDAEIQKNEQNGCLRIDRVTDEGKTGQTDLYLLTEHSFHHIIIRYPMSEKGTYFTYIEYMINTMETNETDLG